MDDAQPQENGVRITCPRCSAPLTIPQGQPDSDGRCHRCGTSVNALVSGHISILRAGSILLITVLLLSALGVVAAFSQKYAEAPENPLPAMSEDAQASSSFAHMSNRELVELAARYLDNFVHGLGAGRYPEVVEELARRLPTEKQHLLDCIREPDNVITNMLALALEPVTETEPYSRMFQFIENAKAFKAYVTWQVLGTNLNMDGHTSSGYTITGVLAMDDKRIHLLRFMLEWGASPNATDRVDHHTPLGSAAASGAKANARLLLDLGAQIDGDVRADMSPLAWALSHARYEMAQFLQEARATLRYQETFRAAVEANLWMIDPGSRAASKYGVQEILHIQRETARVIGEAREYGGPNPYLAATWILLHYPEEHGLFNAFMTREVLLNGMDLNGRLPDGRTLLLFLVMDKRWIDQRLFILDRLENFEETDTEGWTAMDAAAANGVFSSFIALQTYGANPNGNPENPWSPLALALVNGHAAIAKQLKHVAKAELRYPPEAAEQIRAAMWMISE